jgi:hypothetical protein
MLAEDSHVSIEQLQEWNSWIGSDCNTGLYANLTIDDDRAVCIAVNASAPTMTAKPGPSTVLATMTASMGPTETGIVAGCTQYYTVEKGDSCASVDAQFAITFAMLYQWNPASKY